MIVGSIKEDINLEKRVSITPETAKNIIALGLSVYLEKNYATHFLFQTNFFLMYSKNHWPLSIHWILKFEVNSLTSIRR